MSFWSDIELEKNLSNVVDPADPQKVDTSGYRLSVGNKVYITKASGDQGVESTDEITIPPGQFALISTKEKVTVPLTAIGFISIRATVKFKGLINVSGFHVDPGYSDHLIFSVFNAGPKPITILKDEDIFLIWFANLDQKNNRSKFNAGPKLNGNIPSSLINNVNMQVDSTAALSERFKGFERTLDLIKPIMGFLFTALVAYSIWVFMFLNDLKNHSEVTDKNFSAINDDTDKEISALKVEYQSLRLSLENQKYSDSQRQILESINARLIAIENKQLTVPIKK